MLAKNGPEQPASDDANYIASKKSRSYYIQLVVVNRLTETRARYISEESGRVSVV